MEREKMFEDKLKKLECPFTWDMDDIDKTISTDYKPHDEEELIPLLKLLRTVMVVYVQSKDKEETEIIINNLEKCDEIMITVMVEPNPKFSTKAVYHIVRATQCHALWNLNEKVRAKDILAKLEVLQSPNRTERSTINACRSICWSQYHLLGSEEAVEFIRRALTDDPECDLWFFILGKNLRRIRRDSSVGAIPSEEEANAFLKAYEKSKNVLFGIFVAQMYREQRRNRLAFQMYQEILRSKPKSKTILLRLALGFMQLLKLPLAKLCLEEVALTNPEDCMYLHYRGRYCVKKKKFDVKICEFFSPRTRQHVIDLPIFLHVQEAAYYFKKAADMGNYPAAKEYLRYVVKAKPSFNVTEYLKNMVDAYKTLPEKHIQCLLLEIAHQYWQSHDVKNALKYYRHSIEIDSESQALTEHYSLFQPGSSQNIYHLLAKEILPNVKQNTKSLDEDTFEMLEDLENYYEKYMKSEINTTRKVFRNMRTKA